MFGHESKEERKENREILESIRHIEKILRHMLTPKSARLFLTTKGDKTMPASIAVGGKGAKATYQEFNGPSGTGNAVPPVGTVNFASDNPSVATVDALGNIAAVSPGTANITASDSGAPQVSPASDVLTVTPAQQGNTPVSATLTLTAN